MTLRRPLVRIGGRTEQLPDGDTLAGAGGLVHFVEAEHTSAPNAVRPVNSLSATGSAENIGIALVPKGTGALSLQVPDGTAAGGNVRGTNAIDLQSTRTAATQVAAASGSVAIGNNNTAQGLAVASAKVAIGSGNTVGGSPALRAGGVAIGTNNVAQGPDAVAIGGNNSAQGGGSLAMGTFTSTRGVDGAVSEGLSATLGAQQLRRIPLRFDTSGATPTPLTSTGSTAGSNSTAVLPNNAAYHCRVRVLARNTANGEAMSWVGTALIRRGANAASTALVGSSIVSDFGDPGMSACTVALSANTTGGALDVVVTGLPSTTIRWVAQLETVEAA